MSRFLAVAARELRERWLLFPGGLAVGFVPLALPIAGMKREHAPLVGLLFALLFGIVAAFLAGSSVLARDMANGRLGFLFSRPVPWPAIWGGKWVAALVLVAGSGFLAALPWMATFPPATHGGSWLAAMADARGGVFCLSLLFLGIGFSNFTATALRSRSAWLAVDLLLVVATAWAVRRYVAPLLFLGVLDAGQGLAAFVGLAPLAAALLLASAVQFAVGRTDVRRGHRALSLAFWGSVGAALLLAALTLYRVLWASPAELRGGWLATADPTARWIWVRGSEGPGGSHHPGLLVDTATGRYRTPGREEVHSPWAARGASFSGDGKWAVFWRDDRSARTAVELVLLEDASRATTRLALEPSPPPTWRTRVLLSPNGRRLLLVHEAGASLFAADGRRLATAAAPAGLRADAALFLDEEQARVWLAPDRSLGSGPAGALVTTLGSDGRVTSHPFDLLPPPSNTPTVPPRQVLVAVDGGRRLVSLESGFHLRDGTTGAVLATLDERVAGRVLGLADGRIVLVMPEGLDTVVRTFDPDGRLLTAFTLGRTPTGLSHFLEATGGRVLLGFTGPVSMSATRPLSVRASVETLVVDVAAGRIVDRLPDLRPGPHGVLPSDDDAPTSSPVPSARFLWGQEGRLVRVDFATGERSVVLGPGAPRGERISGGR